MKNVRLTIKTLRCNYSSRRERGPLEWTERQHLIEWLTILGVYGRAFLERQSDDEIEMLYNLHIKQLNEE